MKVGLIGVGHVGASVAVSLLLSGAARELLLHDHDPARAEGEAMDHAHGAPYYPRAHVRAASLEDVAACDVVVFAAAERGFTAVKHQREVGTGYFDAVTTTIERDASTAALKGSTEDEQFLDGTHH